MRTSERGGLVKKIERSSFLEHVTEAIFIFFARGMCGKSRYLFLFVRTGTDHTSSTALVLARASEPQSFSIPELLHVSADGHPTVISHVEARMFRIFFLHFDAIVREIRLV